MNHKATTKKTNTGTVSRKNHGEGMGSWGGVVGVGLGMGWGGGVGAKSGGGRLKHFYS